MTYTPCSTMDNYTALEVLFAGDPALLEEIIEHKAACETCKANIAQGDRIINQEATQ